MDKAGITAAAAHNQMMTASSMHQQQQQPGVMGNAGNAASPADADAAIAFKCQMLAQKGFQPIENIFSLKQW